MKINILFATLAFSLVTVTTSRAYAQDADAALSTVSECIDRANADYKDNSRACAGIKNDLKRGVCDKLAGERLEESLIKCFEIDTVGIEEAYLLGL